MLLITGMNGSLGKALSHEALARGLPLSGVVRNSKAVDQVRDLVEKGANVFIGDLSDLESIQSLIQEISLADNVPDTVIINAALISDDVSGCALTDDVGEIIFTNLTGPLILLSGLLPHLRKRRGRAIAISSLSAQVATDQRRVAYPASKAGLSMAFSALRLQRELKPVQFITVEPGLMAEGSSVMSISYARAAERIIDLVEASDPPVMLSFPMFSKLVYRIMRILPRRITTAIINLRTKFVNGSSDN